MKINTKIVITQPDGKPYKDMDNVVIDTDTSVEEAEKRIKNAPDITLGKVVGKTLATAKSTDPWKSYKLVNDFLKDTVDLKSEDITFIKDLLKESNYYPYIIGQVIDILENPPKNK